jgi:hypothetical protein
MMMPGFLLAWLTRRRDPALNFLMNSEVAYKILGNLLAMKPLISLRFVLHGMLHSVKLSGIGG